MVLGIFHWRDAKISNYTDKDLTTEYRRLHDSCGTGMYLFCGKGEAKSGKSHLIPYWYLSKSSHNIRYPSYLFLQIDGVNQPLILRGLGLKRKYTTVVWTKPPIEPSIELTYMTMKRRTYESLKNTEFRISNETKGGLLILVYFVSDVTTGAGVYSSFAAVLPARETMSLKFPPSAIDWVAGNHCEKLNFHFWMDGYEPVELPFDYFKGNEEYICKTEPGGFGIKPKDGHCCSCCTWKCKLKRKFNLISLRSSSPNVSSSEAETDGRLESAEAVAKVDSSVGGRGTDEIEAIRKVEAWKQEIEAIRKVEEVEETSTPESPQEGGSKAAAARAA